MVESCEQPEKAEPMNCFVVEGSLMLVIDVHPLNAFAPKLISSPPSTKLTYAALTQPSNALSPMEVVVAGISM